MMQKSNYQQRLFLLIRYTSYPKNEITRTCFPLTSGKHYVIQFVSPSQRYPLLKITGSAIRQRKDVGCRLLIYISLQKM